MNFDVESEQFLSRRPLLDDCYRLAFTLGRGRYGKVYQAVHLPSCQKMAIKVLPCGVGHEEMFLHELAMTMRSAHEGVIELLDAGLCGKLVRSGKPPKYVNYFVMPLAQRGELYRLLFETGQFSEQLAKTLFRKLAQTLLHLHQEGTAHRDIKAENILVWPDQTLKLVDFGFATQFDAAISYLQDDEKVGSPAYNAPEQLDGSCELNLAAVDIFALGVVLFEMLFSSAPFALAAPTDKYFRLLARPDKTAFWKVYSQQYTPTKTCKHLLERMLDPCPFTRLTLPEVLQHPWLQDEPSTVPHKQLESKMCLMLEVLREEQEQAVLLQMAKPFRTAERRPSSPPEISKEVRGRFKDLLDAVREKGYR